MAGAWILPTILVLVIGNCWTAEIYFVFSVYYNKHLISEQPQLDVACKVFRELVLQIIFNYIIYHFALLASFLTASNCYTKTVLLIFSYLHREAIRSRLPASWFGFSKYKNSKCSDKEPRPHFNDHKLNQHLCEAALILIQNWWDEIVAAAPAWLYLYVGHLIKYHKYTFWRELGTIGDMITGIFNGFYSIVGAHLNLIPLLYWPGVALVYLWLTGCVCNPIRPAAPDKYVCDGSIICFTCPQFSQSQSQPHHLLLLNNHCQILPSGSLGCFIWPGNFNWNRIRYNCQLTFSSTSSSPRFLGDQSWHRQEAENYLNIETKI